MRRRRRSARGTTPPQRASPSCSHSAHPATPCASSCARARQAPDTTLRPGYEGLLGPPLASMRPTDRPYAGLAWFYAEAGQAERGRQLLAEYAVQVPEAFRLREPFRHAAAAAVARAEGQVQDAIKEYRAWYEEDSCAVCGLYELGRVYERAG